MCTLHAITDLAMTLRLRLVVGRELIRIVGAWMIRQRRALRLLVLQYHGLVSVVRPVDRDMMRRLPMLGAVASWGASVTRHATLAHGCEATRQDRSR